MLHRPAFFAILLLVLAACDGGSAPAPSAATQASDRVFDAGAMLDPGTKGLVIVGGNAQRPTYWDFDRVPYGAQLHHTFQVRNDEGRDVAILDLLPSCGCAQARVQYVDANGATVAGVRGAEPVLVVPAAASFELVVDIDTTTQIERLNLDKLAQVRMRSDAPRAPYLTFELHLVVERTFRAVPSGLEFGEIAQSAGKSMRSDVSPETRGDGARITGVELVEGPFTATVDPTQQGDVLYWIVVAEAKKGLPLGPALGKVRLATVQSDGQPGAPFELPLRGQIVPDVVAHPALFAFGAFERDATKAVTIDVDALAEGDAFTFLSAEAQGVGADKLGFERVPIEPGVTGPPAHAAKPAPKWRITLRTSSDFPLGPFSGPLLVKTDHPRVPELRVPYHGVAK
ncbi:MAG: hypothetical protein HZA53_17005 [Planctomycetes bacterium]|nr:hypothetical protein [Planctomycetota bacterium]